MSETDDVVPIGLAILSFGGIGLVLASIAGKVFGSVTRSNAYTTSSEVSTATASANLWVDLFTIGVPLTVIIVVGAWIFSRSGR